LQTFGNTNNGENPKLPACPQRGEDIHFKQAGLVQAGGLGNERLNSSRTDLEVLTP